MSDIRPVRWTSVVDDVIDQIRRLIITGQLKPGQRLPSEMELAEQFSLGRPALREALKSLVMLGLLHRNRQGTFVSSTPERLFAEPLSYMMLLAHVTVSELYEVRKLLEVHHAGLAAQRATAAQIAELERLHAETIERSVSNQEFVQNNFSFHMAIAVASGNQVLVQIMQAIRHLLSQAEVVGAPLPGLVEESIHSHERILAAIKVRDVYRAQQEMLAHLCDVEGRLLSATEPLR